MASRTKNRRRNGHAGFLGVADGQKVFRCGLYTRVSTDMQANKDDGSLEAQEDRLQNYLRSRSDESKWEVADVYREEGCSGKDMDRPELQRLLADVEQSKVNMVLVTKLDRFTRSVKDFHNTYDVLQAHDCLFISISENFDTATATGKMVLNILLAFAEFEREMIGDRTKTGMRYMAKQGHWLGGWIPLGYDVTESGLVPNEEEVKVVRLMFEKYLELGSVAQVTKYLNNHGYRMKKFDSRRGKSQGGGMFYVATLTNMLQDATYIGKIDYEGDRFEGRHQPILDESLWQGVQEALRVHSKRRTNFRQPMKHTFVLLGLVRCGLCGAHMTNSNSTHPKKRYFYYRCTKEDHHGKTACKMKQVAAQELEEVVLQRLKELSTNEELVKTVVANTNTGGEDKTAALKLEKARTARLLGDLNKQIDHLVNHLAQGFAGSRSVQERLRKMEAQQRDYQREMDDLDFKIRRIERERLDAEIMLSSLHSLSYLIGQATPQELQAIIPTLVDSIVVSPDGITIRLIEQLAVGPKEKASAKVNPEGNFALADIIWLRDQDSNLGPSG